MITSVVRDNTVFILPGSTALRSCGLAIAAASSRGWAGLASASAPASRLWLSPAVGTSS